ncbi:MAG TPA: hypothetical protein VME46_04490 [Acidimicrobiales bacterium]|nr:hypothetical protein [Acidimicrobiales bacterium]
MADVFISYSRRGATDMVDHLAALTARSQWAQYLPGVAYAKICPA